MNYLSNKQLMAAATSFGVSVIFCFLAFYNTDAEVYLFPRIIAAVLIVLSVIQLVNVLVLNRDESAKTARKSNLIKTVPGIIIGVIYFLVMETVGFYASSTLAFLLILLVYGKRKSSNSKALLLKCGVSLIFLTTIYLLFWKGLNVMTPTGWIL